LKKLGCKNFSSAVYRFFGIILLTISETQFWHQFGINVAVMSDFIAISILENCPFFVSEMHFIQHFEPDRVGNAMHRCNPSMH